MDAAEEGGGGGMSIFGGAWDYIVDPANWEGRAGIGARILEHLWYSLLAVALSAAVAVPLGALIGHLRRGEVLVVGLVNALRSLPTLGLLTFLVLLLGLGLIPPILALVVLGIPPLLAGTYSGVANVDRTVVDAARAMGMTEWQVLSRVEAPNALPLMLGGLRNATLQIIATAAVAAYVNLGGLGRYIFDGLALRQYDRVLVGALLVTILALAPAGYVVEPAPRSGPTWPPPRSPARTANTPGGNLGAGSGPGCSTDSR
jgi:osmoprotectant transport system permease protein